MRSSVSPASPTHLQIGLTPHLCCFDLNNLSFSWQFPKAGYQTAYRIMVTQGDHGAVSFDSGWVSDQHNTSVKPNGISAALQPDRLYFWQVAIQYREPEQIEINESPFSAPMRFVTAPEIHSITGLWADEALFSFLRRAFTLPPSVIENISCAVLTATATSPEPTKQYVYHAYLNGQSVGLGPSRLGKTVEGKEILYTQSFDVTALLTSGNNCLGAICYATVEKAFYCRLTVYDHSGNPIRILETDESRSWEAFCGDPVYRPGHSIGTHYYTAHACNVDGRYFPHDFAKAGYASSAWTSPRVKPSMNGDRLVMPTSTATLQEYVSPSDTITVTQTSDSSYLIDLGREIVGGFRMTLPCSALTEMTLLYGEELTSESHVLAPMRTGNFYREQWTFIPGGQPLSTLSLMTYRYIEILDCPVSITPDMVQGLEIRGNFDENSSIFQCDDPLLSRIWDLVKHTVKVTSQDLYVDSQSRERTAYEGDLLINLMAAYACGGDLSVGRFTTEYLCTHRTWPAEYPLFVIMAAWEDYMATGDISFLKKYAPLLETMTYTEYLHKETGLIASPGTQPSQMNSVLVDWPTTERDGYDTSVTYNTVFNALCVRAYRSLSMIWHAVGDENKGKKYADLVRSITDAMIRYLYDPSDGGFFDGCGAQSISQHKSQHAAAFCLSCGIIKDVGMAHRIAAFLKKQGGIRMSVYGAFFLLEGLYTHGHGDIANDLMLSQDNTEGARTWCYMLDTLKATVTTEAWNRTNKPNMTYSHPWGAAPAHMIASGIFGISPTAPGYNTFVICPCLPASMKSAHYTLSTVKGPIAVSVDLEKSECRITVPFNTTATFCHPDGALLTQLSSGNHLLKYPY